MFFVGSGACACCACAGTPAKNSSGSAKIVARLNPDIEASLAGIAVPFHRYSPDGLTLRTRTQRQVGPTLAPGGPASSRIADLKVARLRRRDRREQRAVRLD